MSSGLFDNLSDADMDEANAEAHLPASVRVYMGLRRRIVSLELPPGLTLDRSALAERYKVSQSPLREAIMRLEQEALVISYPQSRTVVTRIDPARVREEHFLRSSVESEVVRQLSEMDDTTATKKARGILRMQEALSEDVEQTALFRQLDDAFHEALFAGVNQVNLHRHIVSRWGHLTRVRSLDLPKQGKMRAVLEGHRAVLDAIEAGDGAAAGAAMRAHLSGTVERIADLKREHPDYFI
ncbi:GntR family transcriptional regulator [Chelativorans sp. YIM 93263]|uniref:GntR family transcriptional regulator n=1 Tax=Chelativorans sp. YIM 93263 TaxID=2906648 RepID=UPI00237824E3|nr:GntR family transcriptional regulator [Chelativorans sp. YIM 93263]